MFAGVTAVNLRGPGEAGEWVLARLWRTRTLLLESPCLFLGAKKAAVSGGGDRNAGADGGVYNESFI